MFKLSCFSVAASCTVVVLALCLPVSAFAYTDPSGFRSSPIDCQNYLKGLQYRREQAEAAGKTKADLTTSIEKAREKFWAMYPNNPGAVKAREESANWLLYKDLYYLRLSLLVSQDKDLSARRGSDFMANILDRIAGLQTADGGIRQSAKPEFAAWVEAIRTRVFEGHTSNSMDDNCPTSRIIKEIIVESFQGARSNAASAPSRLSNSQTSRGVQGGQE